MGRLKKLLEKFSRMPPEMRYEEVALLLEHFGFEEARSKGSHHSFRHRTGRMLTLPKEGGKMVKKAYLKQVREAIEDVTGKAIEELMEEA